MKSMKIKFVFKLSDFLSFTELHDYSMWAKFGEKETYRHMSQRLVIGGPLVRFPWPACRSVLGRDTEPGVLVVYLHGNHRHQCMKSLGTEASICKCTYG